jgi:spore coat polysaccharide biosynthesis protein SpsF
MTGKIIAIVQARMGSRRLPGKVLQAIAGQPMLALVVERAGRATTLDGVVVATTTDSGDDPVAELCAARGYPCYRGSAQDVLDRYYQAAHAYEAEVVVRLTGDCPLIDPGVIDRTVQAFLQAGVDFAANRLPPPWKRTYPIGLDTEVCTIHALSRAWREAHLPHHREHVMPYLYEEQGRFQVLVVESEQDHGGMRWAVDTPEDLALVRQVYAHLESQPDFTWEQVLGLFEQHPELNRVNAGVRHKDYREADTPDSDEGPTVAAGR